jgi:ABC transport system ATP-binding/permease protein
MPSLEARFQQALSEVDLRVDPVDSALASDIVRLLVRSVAGDLDSSVVSVLESSLKSRTALCAASRNILIKISCEPSFRTGITSQEIGAFGLFFGQSAATSLEQEEAGEVGLEQFSLRYGPETSLVLLEAFFQVAVAKGALTEDAARRLEASAKDLGVDPLVVSAFFQRYDSRFAEGDRTWKVVGDRVTIGRSPSNDVVIPDPQVGKHHCTLIWVGNVWRIEGVGGRPVLVDGVAVSSSPVSSESRIGVGPWTLRVNEREIKGFGHRSFQALSVSGLNRKIGDIVLLEDVDFTIFSGEVVALVGPSGAGKTTLINAIAGIAPADSGDVTLGGGDFHAILESEPSGVGIVPQEDLVHAELTVEESLYYSGRLRLPSDVGREDISAQVDRVLGELDIRHIADSRIGDVLHRGISGGQRKRVNLGQELLTRSTRVLFLDEPTSGLDPKSSHEIAKQVRQLADGGRLVFLVTHDLSTGILQQVDHLLVMVQGGRLAYFGAPEDACAYFRVPSADLIFSRLGERSADDWAKQYKESKDRRRYVTTRSQLLAGEDAPVAETTELTVPDTRRDGRRVSSTPTGLQQLRTLTSRYFRTKIRDKVGMAVFWAQPPILALVMWIVFSQPTVPALFMISLSWLWFGMSASVRELILDRAIWQREHKIGVGVTPYVGSKVLVLGGMVGAQAVLFTTITWWALGLGAAPYLYSLPLLILSGVLTAFAGMTLSLAISAWLSSTEAAVATLPLMLIPQICFSSMLVPLKGMGALAKLITYVTLERFAFDATLKSTYFLRSVRDTVTGNDTYAHLAEWGARGYGEIRSNGALYNLGLKPPGSEDYGIPFSSLCLILMAFSVGFLILTWLLVWRRARR